MRRIRPFAAIAALSLPALCSAQSVLVPGEPPHDRRSGPRPIAVETALLQVKARIQDGAATTEIVQTLRNRTAQQQEAIWILPLPEDATADRFAMTVDGKETNGEVLDQHRARAIYEDIVRRRRDPGLLEYAGTGMLRVRVFPIQPHGDVQVKVRYAQLLRPTDAVTTYRFPLRAAFADGIGPERCGVSVEVSSQTPIKTVWSPLPGFDFRRTGDHEARGSIEFTRAAPPPRDLSLHYGTAAQDFGLHALTHRRPGEPGYFLLLLSPKRDWPAAPALRRSVTLVVDTSGSMAGRKIEQARAAVQSFLRSLPDGDWFNVVPFSTDARPFFPAPMPATRDNVEAALQRTAELQARGGTNIEEALALALAAPTGSGTAPAGTVPIVVFVTDGQPTVGATDVDALLAQARQRNTGKARLFVLGVGHDVNTRLLDVLAAESRGDRDYVQPDEDIEHKTSALFARLSGPVLTDLRLSVDGLAVEDLEPRLLPDLFVQGQLAVVGRYRGQGHSAIRLRGQVGQEQREYVFEATFPERNEACDWLPALWAQRKVATLLDAIRLRGSDPELVAEVVRLGKEHGIVTPYTSHLVVEEGQQLAGMPQLRRFGEVDSTRDLERLREEWNRGGEAPMAPAGAIDLRALQDRARREAAAAERAMTARDETGAGAVQKSAELKDLFDDGGLRRDGAAALLHQRVGGRVFHLVGATWIDRALTAELAARMRKVAAFSPEYFELLRQRPHLRAVFAFSTQLVVVDGGEAIEITAGG